MKKSALLLFSVLAAFALAYAWRGGYLYGDGRIVKRTRFLMDTLVTIQVPNEGGRYRAETAIERAFDRMAEVDRKFNGLNPQSPVYKFNHDRLPVADREIYALLKTAAEISAETGGAFDITAYPLVDLWGFYSTSVSSQTVPSPEKIRAARSRVGWRRFRFEGGVVVPADGEVMIDLGGIAKGYALGEGVKALKAGGMTAGLILAGGQVQTFGSAAPGVPWKVGLRNPRKEGYIAGLPFDSELGISTSGDYERFFEVNGARYHHILDPKTGYPARGVMSMSVITPDPVRADALSTALFVMGPERALAFARSRRGLDVIVVDAEGKISSSRENPAGAVK